MLKLALGIGKIVAISDILVTRCLSQYPIKTVSLNAELPEEQGVGMLCPRCGRGTQPVAPDGAGTLRRGGKVHTAVLVGSHDTEHSLCVIIGCFRSFAILAKLLLGCFRLGQIQGFPHFRG